MKRALALVAALLLAACASAPVTDTTRTFCTSLPLVRLGVDAAIARGDRKMTKQDKADLATVRAAEDLRCAQAASAPN